MQKWNMMFGNKVRPIVPTSSDRRAAAVPFCEFIVYNLYS